MKKLFLFTVAVILLAAVAGCQQAKTMQADVTRALNDASQQVETTKTQVIDAKNKLDQKVTQAQQAADAIKKLGE